VAASQKPNIPTWSAWKTFLHDLKLSQQCVHTEMLCSGCQAVGVTQFGKEGLSQQEVEECRGTIHSRLCHV
jgi:hypothetical protein